MCYSCIRLQGAFLCKIAINYTFVIVLILCINRNFDLSHLKQALQMRCKNSCSVFENKYGGGRGSEPPLVK